MRQPEIRRAFNSPSGLFAVATTSVGQEGIDFHWLVPLSRALEHASHPVDFDQREGRVHRYAADAIRRNIAAQLREEILSHETSGTSGAAYAVAVDQVGGKDELAPHWIFPGSAQIERVILPYILSVDHDRLLRLKDDSALYRLAFGQPRQEDLVDLLRRRGVHQDPALLAELRLDLRPRFSPPLRRSPT